MADVLKSFLQGFSDTGKDIIKKQEEIDAYKKKSIVDLDSYASKADIELQKGTVERQMKNTEFNDRLEKLKSINPELATIAEAVGPDNFGSVASSYYSAQIRGNRANSEIKPYRSPQDGHIELMDAMAAKELGYVPAYLKGQGGPITYPKGYDAGTIDTGVKLYRDNAALLAALTPTGEKSTTDWKLLQEGGIPDLSPYVQDATGSVIGRLPPDVAAKFGHPEASTIRALIEGMAMGPRNELFGATLPEGEINTWRSAEPNSIEDLPQLMGKLRRKGPIIAQQLGRYKTQLIEANGHTPAVVRSVNDIMNLNEDGSFRIVPERIEMEGAYNPFNEVGNSVDSFKVPSAVPEQAIEPGQPEPAVNAGMQAKGLAIRNQLQRGEITRQEAEQQLKDLGFTNRPQ